MKNRLSLLAYLILGGGLLALSACSASPTPTPLIPASGSGSATPVEMPTALTVPDSSTIEVSTAVAVPSSGGGVVTSGTAVVSNPADATAAPLPTRAPGEQLVITPEFAGQTVTVKVGESFLVKMGGEEQMEWTVMVQDPSIVDRVKGIAVIRGAQGVYEAKAAGTTKLSITGDPLCRQSTPACMAPSQLIEVTVVVQ